MSISKTIPKEVSESILVGISDVVARIDIGITLPDQGKNDLGDLKKSIEENGVEVPILVRANGSGGYYVIDGGLRLQICRELGKDCPATLLKNIDDTRAREIALEENLGRRAMTNETKKKIAFQLRDLYNYSYSKIAKLLCVHRTAVSDWFKAEKPSKEAITDLHKTLSATGNGARKRVVSVVYRHEAGE